MRLGPKGSPQDMPENFKDDRHMEPPDTNAQLREDFALISRIADRSIDMGDPRKKWCIVLDLGAVHETIGLRLQDLLDADDNDFMHDILGIRMHLDRKTKQLTHCFLPRFHK